MMRVEKDFTRRGTSRLAAFKKGCKAFGEEYSWLIEEMEADLEAGYYCGSNAVEHMIPKFNDPTHPKTNDWSYYWGSDDLGDGIFYFWFIERR